MVKIGERSYVAYRFEGRIVFAKGMDNCKQCKYKRKEPGLDVFYCLFTDEPLFYMVGRGDQCPFKREEKEDEHI